MEHRAGGDHVRDRLPPVDRGAELDGAVRAASACTGRPSSLGMTRSDFAASSAGVLVADDPVRVGEVERRPVTGRSLSVSTGYRAWRPPGAAPGGGPRVAPRVPNAASRMRW